MAQPDGVIRIAMWSGPRNISTAMMRSWGSRLDTHVVDEPFYAHYLALTGADHPGADEVLRHHAANPEAVVRDILFGPLADGRRIHYQKHMAHHLVPDVPRDWIGLVRNALLIRDPEEMLPSLARFVESPTLSETGLPQQVEIFERLREDTGRTPPVVDSRDVLMDPPATLRRLCTALRVPFSDRMLSWRPGPHRTDGVWAKHWYAAVEATTTFQPYRPKNEETPPHVAPLLEECRQLYDRLHRYRIIPDQA